MAGYINPIASGMGGLEFAPLLSDDIKKISVKKIYATPALDSMLGPVLGGLHDPALGAILQLDTEYVSTLCVDQQSLTLAVAQHVNSIPFIALATAATSNFRCSATTPSSSRPFCDYCEPSVSIVTVFDLLEHTSMRLSARSVFYSTA